MKYKTKSTAKSIGQRMRYLSKEVKGVSIEASKAHCKEIIKTIADGLMKGNLVKPPLRPITLRKKREAGKPHITSPLVGWGQYDKRSMINGLRLYRGQKGYSVFPQGEHYSGIKQIIIWSIHEYGKVIQTGEGTIRIPPRMPLRMGLARYMRSQKRNEVSKDMIKFMKSILEGNKAQSDKIRRKFEKEI